MPDSPTSDTTALFIDSLIASGGETGRLIADFDWTKTSIGPIETWSQSLRTAVGILLRSPVPIVMLWNEDGVMLYNDGYSVFAGERHPKLLGSKVREGWPEVADFNDNIMRVGLGGGTLAYRNHVLSLNRTGTFADVWLDLDYSPVPDETGKPAGVIAIVIEITERVMAERRAADERGRLLTMLQRMPGFVALLEGPRHIYTYVNDAHRELTGDRDVLGQSIPDVFPELAEQGVQAMLDQVYATGESFSGRAVPVRLKGREDGDRFLDLLCEPMRDVDGKIIGIFVSGYDVTDARREQLRREALIRATDIIRDNFDSDDIIYETAKVLGETLGVSRVGYGRIDPATDVIYIGRDWNAEGIKTISGSVEVGNYGTFIKDLQRGDTVVIDDVARDDRTADRVDRLKLRQALSLVNVPIIEQGRLVAMLFVNQDAPRHWRPQEVALIEQIANWLRVAVERVRTEASLRHLNEDLEHRITEALSERKLLADIVESTDAFIQVADLDFNWMAINRASANEFEHIYGVRPKPGENMLDMLKDRPDHQAAVRQIWARALSGESFTAVDDFGDPSLDRRYYEMKFNPLHDADGRIIGAYQFVYDVSERLRDQARLVAAEDQLRQAQKMEAVGQLTGGIAHDFNNMLAVVMGSLDLLNRRIGPEDPRARRYVESAVEGAKRAASLTQRLLAFSRQQPLRPEAIDANKLVSGMSDMLRHSIGADIRLETVLAGGLWRVNADPNQLESVILNLGVNARDAMPNGGKLTIETQNAYLDARYVASEVGVPAGQYVLIAITDTGTGMPPDVIAKAFDPFFTTKDVGKGTGLGLSQVYGFVKQSGGHVKIYSEIGQGTSIKIYLPRVDESGLEAEATDITADLVTGDEREVVLVVDDEPAVRQFSCDALAELGYRVLEAPDAATALSLLGQHPDIALLFTDIVMPDTNGRKLADEAHKLRPNLKVLYTTGYTRNAVVHNGIVDKGVHLIGKPFTIDELAVKVRDLLDS